MKTEYENVRFENEGGRWWFYRRKPGEERLLGHVTRDERRAYSGITLYAAEWGEIADFMGRLNQFDLAEFLNGEVERLKEENGKLRTENGRLKMENAALYEKSKEVE